MYEDDSLLQLVSGWISVIVSIVVLIGCWLYSISEWGWLLGIAFGWIPSLIIALMAAFISYFIWWLLLVIILFAIVKG